MQVTLERLKWQYSDCCSWGALAAPASRNGVSPRSLLYVAWECIILGNFPLATDFLSNYTLLQARGNSVTFCEYTPAGEGEGC